MHRRRSEVRVVTLTYLVTCQNSKAGVMRDEEGEVEEGPPAGQCSRQPLSCPPVSVTPSVCVLSAPASILPPRLLTLKMRTSSALRMHSVS